MSGQKKTHFFFTVPHSLVLEIFWRSFHQYDGELLILSFEKKVYRTRGARRLLIIKISEKSNYKTICYQCHMSVGNVSNNLAFFSGISKIIKILNCRK